MNIVEYYSLSQKQKDIFLEFCKNIFADSSDRSSVNMWDENWQTKPNTLPYLLHNTDTFKTNNGMFNIVYDQESIVACGGVYKSKSISFAGSRLWIEKSYRNKHIARDIILPEHKRWSKSHGCKAVAICFNDYNKNLIESFKRIRLGEYSDRLINRTSDHLFYSNLHQVDFPVVIRGTKQWILYEKLDESWDYDWSKISYQPA